LDRFPITGHSTSAAVHRAHTIDAALTNESRVAGYALPKTAVWYDAAAGYEAAAGYHNASAGYDCGAGYEAATIAEAAGKAGACLAVAVELAVAGKDSSLAKDWLRQSNALHVLSGTVYLTAS